MFSQTRTPLLNYAAFSVATYDELAAIIGPTVGARLNQISKSKTIEAGGHKFSLSKSDLWYCNYGSPVSIQLPESDDIRLQLPLSGFGETQFSKYRNELTPQKGCISPSEAELKFAGNYEQIVWRIPRAALLQRLTGMFECPFTQGLMFEPTVDLTSPETTALQQIVNCLIQSIDSGFDQLSRIVLPELEQALITAVLTTCKHNASYLFDKPVLDGASWQVRRAEEYIISHLDEPISIDELAVFSGTSARTLFRMFKASRGCSPSDFIKGRRLAKAFNLLKKSKGSMTVTEIALDCGYSDMGHFSKDFKAAFGECPSKIRSTLIAQHV